MSVQTELHEPSGVVASSSGRSVYRVRALIDGLMIALFTTLVSQPFMRDVDSGERIANSISVFLGMWSCIALAWWLLVPRRNHIPPLRAALASMLGTLLAYPVTYIFAGVIYGPEQLSEGLPTQPGILQGLLDVFGLSLLAIAVTGWLLAPLNGLLGAGLAGVRNRLRGGAEEAMLPRVGALRQSWQQWRASHPVLGWVFVAFGAIVFVVVVLGGWVWTRPLHVEQLVSHPNRAANYEAAVEQITALQRQQEQDPAMDPKCVNRLMTHGQKVANVVVMYHGFTSCPEQFPRLGETLFQRGYNVYIPAMPHHGLRDHYTPEQSLLTSEELVNYADRSVDVAQGLGEKVTLVGLSGGGMVATWAAQNRSDISSAVIIAPMYNLAGVPTFLLRPLASAAQVLPNLDTGDAEAFEASPDPKYGYPLASSRASGAFLRLSHTTSLLAGKAAPMTKDIVVVTNAADDTISNDAIVEMVRKWKDTGAQVRTYTFPASLNLRHDLVGATQPRQRVDIVYPVLLDFITGKR